MRPERFRRRLLAIPIRYRLMFRFLRPILWALSLVPEIREQFLLGMVERDANEYRRRPGPLEELLVDQRDEWIVAHIEAFVRAREGSDESRYVAVVFGAGHMPAISLCLSELGFRPATRKWFEVLCLDDCKAG
jgi:pheromone shutdown protein TraB